MARGQQSRHPPRAGAHPGGSRPRPRRVRRDVPQERRRQDSLYAIEASRDYDPAPGLERITAPLVAINSADDIINPPELGILERGIRRVRKGQAIVLPFSDRTVGHGTHTMAALWKQHLEALLAATGVSAEAGR